MTHAGDEWFLVSCSKINDKSQWSCPTILVNLTNFQGNNIADYKDNNQIASIYVALKIKKMIQNSNKVENKGTMFILYWISYISTELHRMYEYRWGYGFWQQYGMGTPKLASGTFLRSLLLNNLWFYETSRWWGSEVREVTGGVWCYALPVVCLFRCNVRWSERANVRSQNWHLNGLAPVCFL